MASNRSTAIGSSVTLGTNTAQFENQIELLLNKYASDANDLLLEPTRTWENHEVTFSREFRKEANRIHNVVFTESEVYFWLNYGTSVRHVLFVDKGKGVHGVSSVGKTRVRSLQASGGEQRGIVVSKKKYSFPGIHARAWTEVVQERLQPQFTLDMQKLAFEAANVRTR